MKNFADTDSRCREDMIAMTSACITCPSFQECWNDLEDYARFPEVKRRRKEENYSDGYVDDYYDR